MVWLLKGLPLIVRVFLGLVFLAASVQKVVNPADFAQIVSRYQILPAPLVNPAAIGSLIRVFFAAWLTTQVLNRYRLSRFFAYPPLVLLALAGERERVNEIAAEIDAVPFGYLALMRAVHSCRCGAPFDLDATPRLARYVEDADFEWPPVSPVDWPLKGW